MFFILFSALQLRTWLQRRPQSEVEHPPLKSWLKCDSCRILSPSSLHPSFFFAAGTRAARDPHSELGDFTRQFHGSACSTHDAHVTQHTLLPNLWTDLALNLSSDWLEGIVAGKPHLWSENSSFSFSTGLVRLWNSGRLWATSALSKWKRKSAVRHLWSCLSRPSRERALRQNAN